MVLLQLARKHAWKPVLLHYSNSGDTGGDRNRVVGYAAIAFFGGSVMQNENLSHADPSFTRQHGQALINLARQSIFEHLGLVEQVPPQAAVADPSQPCYQVRYGTFVTLKKAGRLRGCIGNFGSGQTVWSGIRGNALKAAFEDPRFPPLTAAEAPRISLSISILGEPKPLAYRDGPDLQAKLRPRVDGVIIRKGPAGATFLPQVWQQLPRSEDFLSHLCRKAGLAPDAWRHTRLEVYTYQVQYFEEQD
jgi:AmmeMemoRadiSam system protein A